MVWSASWRAVRELHAVLAVNGAVGRLLEGVWRVAVYRAFQEVMLDPSGKILVSENRTGGGIASLSLRKAAAGVPPTTVVSDIANVYQVRMRLLKRQR